LAHCKEFAQCWENAVFVLHSPNKELKDALGGVVNNINSYFIIGKIDGQLTFCHDGMWETAFCISMQKVKENGGVFDGKVDDRGDNNTS
jgi:hypothetical protein